jgi:hypothetical protein
MEASGRIHVPVSLPREKEHQYPLDRRLGWPKSGLYAVAKIKKKKKTPLPLPGIERQSFSPQLSLYWLSYTGSWFTHRK